MKKIGNIIWGIVLIVIGTIIALNALEITDINIFFKGWWTLFIIIPSLIGLIKNSDKVWSLIFLIIGIILLLAAQGILSYTIIYKLVFPLILVIIGINLTYKEVFTKKINENIKKINAEKKTDNEYCTTFGSQNINLGDQEFYGASIDAIFGSTDLDIRNSTISGDCVINASAIFGEVDIFIPQNVNIKIKATPIFGGTSNKTNIQYKDNLPTIYINSFCLFGGVKIK